MIYELQWIKNISVRHVLLVLGAEIIADVLGVFAALPFVLLFHRGGIVVFIPLIIVSSLIAAIFVKLFDQVVGTSVLVAAALFLAISFGIAEWRHASGMALQNSYIYPLAIGYIFWSMTRRKNKAAQ